ncbi:cobalt-precorrin-6A reductase [Pseudooceanicola onchidii]|uniref:cobalt-precorrin-6A reductase n=1 Tax=Pseudooceanicola onchidii TaxID=2562279 RepID=UPI0010AAE6F5|nr:cobalt-precorrin-6A reductase [Pseudooceanicola onchidii]
MTLLLLAGTAEARQIAAQLAEAGLPVLASRAGAVREVADYPVPTRTGGFGGAEGFLTTLRDHQITAVLDATHPFAAKITERTARLCAKADLPYARLSRPEWTAGPGDEWHDVATPEEAARQIPQGSRVFLATGAQEVARYAALDGRAAVFVRRAEATGAEFPFARGRWIVGRGPFDVDADRALFQLLGIDWIITKNAGGAASRAKLDAARELHLPVVMIARPPEPKGMPILRTTQAAVDWATARCT